MKVFQVCGETIVELISLTLYTVKKEYGKLLVLFQLLIPCLIVWLGTSGCWVLLYSVLLNLVLECIKRIANKLANQTADGFPMHEGRRYTRASGGMVVIDQTKREEALLYLYEVEDYMERRKYVG